MYSWEEKMGTPSYSRNSGSPARPKQERTSRYSERISAQWERVTRPLFLISTSDAGQVNQSTACSLGLSLQTAQSGALVT
jgi:hypothetical protein